MDLYVLVVIEDFLPVLLEMASSTGSVQNKTCQCHFSACRLSNRGSSRLLDLVPVPTQDTAKLAWGREVSGDQTTLSDHFLQVLIPDYLDDNLYLLGSALTQFFKFPKKKCKVHKVTLAKPQM